MPANATNDFQQHIEYDKRINYLTPFDFESIMMYGEYDFSTNNKSVITSKREGVEIKPSDYLTYYDRILLNRFYYCESVDAKKSKIFYETEYGLEYPPIINYHEIARAKKFQAVKLNEDPLDNQDIDEEASNDSAWEDKNGAEDPVSNVIGRAADDSDEYFEENEDPVGSVVDEYRNEGGNNRTEVSPALYDLHYKVDDRITESDLEQEEDVIAPGNSKLPEDSVVNKANGENQQIDEVEHRNEGGNKRTDASYDLQYEVNDRITESGSKQEGNVIVLGNSELPEDSVVNGEDLDDQLERVRESNLVQDESSNVFRNWLNRMRENSSKHFLWQGERIHARINEGKNRMRKLLEKSENLTISIDF